MKIGAVVINHNGSETVLRTVESLVSQGLEWDSIILVDNHSTDGSESRVQREYPFVRVIKLPENMGLTHARNIGLAHLNCDVALFIDDDVYLTSGSLATMTASMQKTGAAVVCPRIVLYPGREFIQCDGAAIHFTGTLALHHAFEPVNETEPVCAPVRAFIGACLLVDVDLLKKLGGFDEDYFFYFEDLELSYRLSALGYAIYCDAQATALHDRGEGTQGLSFRGAGEYPLRRAYLNLRNRWLTMLLYYQLRSFLLLFPALVVYETAAFFEVLQRGWLGVYFRAWGSLFIGLPSILARRRRWQSMRRVPDRDIFIGGSLPLSRGFIAPERQKWLQRLESVLNFLWENARPWM